ncbi:hypothetical protein XACLE20_440031 [Xanthomonas citri pv. citri]|nr:hypothetical protein XACLE20_440031 [Xanthomonas citri pv. citri]CEH59465.1 hypothetical protein XACLE3_8680022 [Xanthomonas citri pv. citri]
MTRVLLLVWLLVNGFGVNQQER